MPIPGMRSQRTLRVAVAALGLSLGAGCTSEELLDAFGADVTPRLDLVPPGLTLPVGLTGFLTPQLAGTAISGSIPSWSSSDPGVAIVDASGNVTCVDVGTARINAVIERSGPDDPTGSAEVTCVEPTLVAVVDDRIAHVHTIGRSPCPDPVGRFGITNTSSDPVLVEVDRGSATALASSVSSVRLGPGESVSVDLLFDCSIRLSFDSTVTVRATGSSGQVQVETIEVAVVVQS